MDWLDRLSIAAIVAITIITIGMVADREIIKRQQVNSSAEAEQEKSSYALQMEMDKKLYQEVISYKEQGLYPEAMAELKKIMKKYRNFL